jgi:hypothetical protein
MITETAVLFVYRLVAYAAKGFFGNAKIRGNDMLRKALQKFRVTVCEISKAFFGRKN